nr:hypothetical protein [Tanacetum cinerariifolium]
ITDGDAAFKVKEPEFEGRKPESEVYVSPSSSAQIKKHDDKTNREAKGKSHVESLTRYRNLSAEFEDFYDNSINKVNAVDSPVPTVGIFISQDKYVAKTLRKFGLTDKKSASTPIDTEKPLLKDPDEGIDCLPNEEIFVELSRMGTSWNEFSSSMALVVIFLSTGVDRPFFEGMIVVQQVDESDAEVSVDDVPTAGVADEGAANVNIDAALTAVDEPSIPSPTPTTQPPPPSQDVPSTSQVQPTLPPSPIDQPPLPQQQPQPLQDAKILMDLLHNLLDICTTLTRRVENLEQ